MSVRHFVRVEELGILSIGILSLGILSAHDGKQISQRIAGLSINAVEHLGKNTPLRGQKQIQTA